MTSDIRIVGFSIRESISTNMLYSVDEAIWSDDFELQNKLRNSAADELGWKYDKNLFSDSNLMIPTLPEKWLINKPDFIKFTALIAVGYSTEVYSRLEKVLEKRTYCIKENSYRGKQLIAFGWQFGGYDVADIELNSILKHCPPREVYKTSKPYLNSYGLLDDESFANEIAYRYGALRNDHSPFFPTAIFFLK